MVFKIATAKQIEFIERLASERKNGHLYVETQVGSKPLAEIGSVQASNIIGVLLNEPKMESVMAKSFGPKTSVTVDKSGLYRNDEGHFIKVQQSKTTGNFYALKLVPVGKKGAFVYEKGLIYSLTPDMKVTLEQGVNYSQQMGFCCMCGRTLTAKESVDAGIGPICAKKF